jgi:phosphoribosylformylglycinamidine synthase
MLTKVILQTQMVPITIAMMCDKTGRHLVMMPHIERSTFQWNWAHYPKDRNDEVSPWHEAFVNARKWIYFIK